MTEDGRPRRASGPPSRRPGRGSVPNEEGLRSLGQRVESQPGQLGRSASPGRSASGGTDRGAGGTAASDTSDTPRAPGDTGSPGGVSRTANETGLAALGQEMYRSHRGRSGRPKKVRSRRRRIVRRTVLITLSVLLVVIAGSAGYAYYLTHDLHRVHVQGLNSALTTGQEAGSENILMVGSTSRCALTVQNPAYGLCSQGVNGVNSDVIMILHTDSSHHRLALLSIPRDLFIPNARSTGPNKIDAGLYQGLSQLVVAIEEDFGIPIQHAVSLNFDQFANIVDALGGINMSFPQSVFDAESGLNVRAASCVHLNGTQALQVVRARHLQYDAPGTTTSDARYWPQEAQSDLARINRDHEFLRVLATAVAKKGLGNPLTDLDLINSVKADLTFDQSWSVNNMASLVAAFHSVDINSVPQLTLPVAVVTDPDGSGGSLVYQGGSYGDVEFPSQAQDQQTIDTVLGINATTDSMTGSALPAKSAVTVSVMNGSGASNQATDTADALSALGFHTVGIGDTSPVGDVAETVVDYGSRSAATEAAAEAVTRSLSGSVIMAYDPSAVADGAQVTVVTGTQFSVNAPPASTTTTPATATTTPTTSRSPTSTDIASPSTSNPTLAPWDPRSCAAGATPTAPVPNET
jgi:polyisoprenyl-teichoic acid--peptidoglycan teichoic acid transferase